MLLYFISIYKYRIQDLVYSGFSFILYPCEKIGGYNTMQTIK